MIKRTIELDSGQGEGAPMEEREREHQSQSGDETTANYLRIDEVAKRTGLSKRTLRYYEELGLLERARRSEGNYRLYRLEDVAALQRIKDMRDLLGLDLEQIHELVKYELEREDARSRFYHQDASPATRLAALDDAERATRDQFHLIQTRIKALDKMGQSLKDRLATYDRLRAEITAQSAQPGNPPAEPDER